MLTGEHRRKVGRLIIRGQTSYGAGTRVVDLLVLVVCGTFFFVSLCFFASSCFSFFLCARNCSRFCASNIGSLFLTASTTQ